jgi:hypothetical protein
MLRPIDTRNACAKHIQNIIRGKVLERLLSDSNSARANMRVDGRGGYLPCDTTNHTALGLVHAEVVDQHQQPATGSLVDLIQDMVSPPVGFSPA